MCRLDRVAPTLGTAYASAQHRSWRSTTAGGETCFSLGTSISAPRVRDVKCACDAMSHDTSELSDWRSNLCEVER